MGKDRRIEPQPGPQITAFQSKADILFYGGQAGGGKSWFLVNEPLRRIGNAKFRGVIFRRTYPELKGQGGVWDECQETYTAMGADLREGQDLDARFPSGASIAFRHFQHEKTKKQYQGQQFAYIGFDEVTHFTQTQFFYMVSRNRSTCGIRPYIRATCNPEPGWVAELLAWWIDQDTGLAIPERSGVMRYMYRNPKTEEIEWGDSKEELLERFPGVKPIHILSVSFINASLADNKILTDSDPGYEGRLMSLSKIERDRLLGGNWKVAEGAQIAKEWIRRYVVTLDDCLEFQFQGQLYKIPLAQTRRLATIDTAGTSKEKAAAKGGKEASWSVCEVWDTVPRFATAVNGRQVILGELCFLRYTWRKQVDWLQLKAGIDETLQNWNVSKAYIENAHFGQALAKEITACPVELIGPTIPGMGDHSEGAKLERAIASGMLARWEHGKFFVPNEPSEWLAAYLRELEGWTGAPGDMADQIDCTSYIAHVTKRAASTWGGVLPSPGAKTR